MNKSKKIVKPTINIVLVIVSFLMFSSFCRSKEVYINSKNTYKTKINYTNTCKEYTISRIRETARQDSSFGKILNIDRFNSVDIRLPAIVSIKQGKSQRVVVVAKQNVIDKLNTKVSNGVLIIKFNNGIDNYRYINLEITVPTIENIKILSAAKVFMSSFKGLKNLKITLKGAGIFKAVEDMTLKGSLLIKNSGVGLINCYKISTKKCKVIVSGVGKCDVRSESELEVEINGVGIVNYKGHPKKIRKEINGLGTLKNQND